jgi:hypothetical protein
LVLAELAVLLLFIDIALEDLKYLLRVVCALDVDDLERSLHACLAHLLVLIEASLHDEEVKNLLEAA